MANGSVVIVGWPNVSSIIFYLCILIIKLWNILCVDSKGYIVHISLIKYIKICNGVKEMKC